MRRCDWCPAPMGWIESIIAWLERIPICWRCLIEQVRVGEDWWTPDTS